MKKHETVSGILGRAIRDNLPVFLLMMLAIAGTIVTGVLPPLVLESIVNTLTAGGTLLFSSVLLYFGLTVLSGLLDSGKEVLITIFGQKVTHETRSTLARKLNRVPADFYTSHDPGDTASCLVNDVNTVEALFTSGIISMITDSFKIISILFVIFTRSLGLGILILCVTPALFFMTMFFQKRMLAAQKENRQAVASANQQIPETIRNIRTIHVLRRIPFMESRYSGAIERSFQAQEKSNFYDAVYSPIIIFVSAVIVAVMISASVRSGPLMTFFGMSVGTAVAIISYVGKIFDPLESIGMEITNIQSAMAGLSRINALLKEEEMPEAAEGASPAEGSAEPALSIRDLSFAYDADRPLFDGFCLDVAQGEMVTISGRTGAGKSTLFKLILGLYAPEGGSVAVCGRDPRALRPEERRKLYGYVEQQFRMVPGTVLQQVTLSDPAVTREQAMDALKLCGLHETVEALPEKEDTPCTAGLFSQGQFQLLSIARAVCSDPRLLLLDEITANLDSGTEAQVLSALQSASAHRTVLSISHRLYEAAGGRRVEVGVQ